MDTHHYIGIDLGASSGRTVLGTLKNKFLTVRELNRFHNGAVNLNGSLHWNVVELFEHMKRGLAACARDVTTSPDSMALDTWGVDYGLLASDGNLLGLPYAYRDGRTNRAMEQFFERIPRERVYALTGNQFMQFNTLFQLFAMMRDKSPLARIVSDVLFMPDLFNYLFTGVKKSEFTISTTSQIYNPLKNDWDEELLGALGLPKTIMQEIVQPGAVIGMLSDYICQEVGLAPVPVIASASHDTGSAVAATPAGSDPNWLYISSGTWSLMGVEAPAPIINEKTLRFNFTNEGGIEGTFRFLKNVAGLWLVQECRRIWAKEKDITFGELTDMAAGAAPFQAMIDPDHHDFLAPQDMPQAIRAFIKKSGQKVGNAPGDIVRVALESLALKYRFVLDQLKQVHATPINKIHIIGGGTQNTLLCQFTANATGLPVVAGPVEATAIGNILTQALGMGHVNSHAEIREIIRNSFQLEQYEPRECQPWDNAYERFREIL
ncbi:MAG: rhamnulokinase [Candidatus Zhuqueibacterota bacterium]